MQQNRFRSLKETKRALFGPFLGTLKKGSFYPISVGSEKGSKLKFFDGLRICNDVDEMVLVGMELEVYLVGAELNSQACVGSFSSLGFGNQL